MVTGQQWSTRKPCQCQRHLKPCWTTVYEPNNVCATCAGKCYPPRQITAAYADVTHRKVP